MSRRKKILIIEDDLQARLGLQELMRSVEYEAEGVGDWLEALRLVKEEVFDLVIVDVFLSPIGKRSLSGLDLIPLLRVFNPKAAVILVTGQGDERLRATALKHGATLYLEKPLKPGLLTWIVQRLLAEAAGGEASPMDR